MKQVNFESYLAEYGKLVYTNVGVSMMPLLRQGKDLFILKKIEGRCNVGDVVLYRRRYSDRYILHRIIEVRAEDYVILGDNCSVREYGIKDDDIIAVMTGFIRDGIEHSVDERMYRFYTFVCLKTVVLRVFMKRVVRFIRHGL